MLPQNFESYQFFSQRGRDLSYRGLSLNSGDALTNDRMNAIEAVRSSVAFQRLVSHLPSGQPSFPIRPTPHAFFDDHPATNIKSAAKMATKDETKDETKDDEPVDTRDALDVLEAEAKEFEKVRPYFIRLNAWHLSRLYLPIFLTIGCRDFPHSWSFPPRCVSNCHTLEWLLSNISNPLLQ